MLVIITGLCMVLCFLFIKSLLDLDAPQFVVAGSISMCNVAVPTLINELVTQFEVHELEPSRISSLFNKKSMYRWFNSAIILFSITGFDATLDQKLVRLCDFQTIDMFIQP
jgi:hypothetical protein